MTKHHYLIVGCVAFFAAGCASSGARAPMEGAEVGAEVSTIETPYTLASEAYYQSNYKEAVKYFNQYIAESSKDDVLMDMALFNLAKSYEKLGDTKKAVATYQKIVDQFNEGYWVDSAKDAINSLK